MMINLLSESATVVLWMYGLSLLIGFEMILLLSDGFPVAAICQSFNSEGD